MKKYWLTFMAVCLSGALLAGCSSETSGSNGTDASKDSAPAATQQGPAGDSTSDGENSKDAASDTKEKRTIGCVIISGTNPHCQIFEEGFRSVVEENGDEAVVLDADYDPGKLMSCLSDLIAQNVDGIVVESCDNQAPIQSIKEAADKGIVVAAADMLLDVGEEENILVSQTVSDNYDGGYQCGLDFAKRANGEEKNYLIMDFETNTAAVERVQGFRDAIADQPNLHLLEVNQPNPETLEAKLALMDTWIQKYDKIDCVFAYHDPAAMACVQALEAAGKLQGTLVYGVDGNIDAIQAISEGKMTATAKQQPDQLAILSTKNMYRVLNGEEIDGDWLTKVPIIFIDETNAKEFLGE